MDRREFDELSRDIESRAESLSRDRERLKREREACPHRWGETRYTPDHQTGYTIPGDKPGTCGSDWRGPVDVAPKTTKRWARQCESCGLEQVTERTRQEHTSGKVAGTGGQIEVPAFPPGNRL